MHGRYPVKFSCRINTILKLYDQKVRWGEEHDALTMQLWKYIDYRHTSKKSKEIEKAMNICIYIHTCLKKEITKLNTCILYYTVIYYFAKILVSND